jgi:hypothetical protein
MLFWLPPSLEFGGLGGRCVAHQKEIGIAGSGYLSQSAVQPRSVDRGEGSAANRVNFIMGDAPWSVYCLGRSFIPSAFIRSRFIFSASDRQSVWASVSTTMFERNCVLADF